MVKVVRIGIAIGLGVVVSSGCMEIQAGAQTTAPGGVATLTIHTDKPAAKVSPTLYGMMTEEINYSYEGGLYAEMVSNRNFLATWAGIEDWVLKPLGNADGSVEVDRADGPSAALKNSMKLTVKQADASNPLTVLNGGWWGMAVRPTTTYTGSFYAKAAGAQSVKVSLVSDVTGKTIASASIPSLGADWKKYDFTLKTGAEVTPAPTNHLTLAFEKPGTVWLQLVSLFPPTYHNRPNGNRADIMEMMAGMNPKFLRMPGGNYLEGDHIRERFDWKKTIGPLVDRPGHRSPWNYRSTDGLGLLEFLEWCEDLKIQPVLAVYAGYSLQQEHVNPGADLEPYVQDALDEIEYVTGDTSTKWGAERAKDGHPATFPLTYVEVGNEDNFDRSKSYDARYAQFYDAIKKKYPNLQIIATTAVKGHVMDVLDDHYYKRAEQFFADVHHYDKTDRNGPKIFIGEWATREGSPTTNFGAALGDAAWMTGMERNSDIIVMSSYAPMFVNVNPGAMQWASDLMGYNAFSVYGSPSYYAQGMFSKNLGTEILPGDLQNAGERFFYSATRSNGTIYLKLVNGSSTPQQIKINLTGASSVKPTAKLVSLSAPSTATTNSITDPKRVVPVESTVRGVAREFTHTVPGYSIEVLNIAAQ